MINHEQKLDLQALNNIEISNQGYGQGIYKTKDEDGKLQTIQGEFSFSQKVVDDKLVHPQATKNRVQTANEGNRNKK